jgi:hypothetical protein
MVPLEEKHIVFSRKTTEHILAVAMPTLNCFPYLTQDEELDLIKEVCLKFQFSQDSDGSCFNNSPPLKRTADLKNTPNYESQWKPVDIPSPSEQAKNIGCYKLKKKFQNPALSPMLSQKPLVGKENAKNLKLSTDGKSFREVALLIGYGSSNTKCSTIMKGSIKKEGVAKAPKDPKDVIIINSPTPQDPT